MQPIRVIAIASLLGIIIFLGVDRFNLSAKNQPVSPAQTAVLYNGYSIGIDSVQYDEQGNVRYILQAERQFSYIEAETLLDEPTIELYQDNQSRWNITARSGTIQESNSESERVGAIVLSGDVEVNQQDRFGGQTTIKTQTLIFDPAIDLLSTDDAVVMTAESFEQTAIGMQVELESEETVFYRNVRGRYATSQD